MNTSTKAMYLWVLAAILCFGQSWAFAQDVTTTLSASEDDDAVAQGVNYWTDERVNDAQALPWYDEENDPEALFFENEPVGPPDSVPGGAPSARRNWSFGAMLDATEPDESDFDEDFGTKDIFDHDYVNLNTTLWKQYPYRAIGKLFFNAGYCSASVISGNNAIVTAAHCCYDRSAKKFYTNFAFVPAMRQNGTTPTQRPYGTFPYTAATVLTAWINSGGRQNDVCVLSLGKNAGGQNVSPTVGWLGRSWNQSTIQHHFAFGYPSNISSGLYKYECSAESYANCGSSLVYGMGCNMTFGASGGPWVRNFKRFTSGAVNHVNSVVSGYDSCTGTFGKSFNGARFTSSNIVPLCTARGC